MQSSYLYLSLIIALVASLFFALPVAAQLLEPEEKQIKPIQVPPTKPGLETPEDIRLKGVLRGFIWGLPPTVILENEKGTFMEEEEGRLVYLDYIRGMKSTIAYEFLENKLWRAFVYIEERYRDPQDYIRKLMVIAEDLTIRYGQPIEEQFIWRDDKEKNYPENWGWAVLKGDLYIRFKWQNAQSEVVAYLGTTTPLKPDLRVTYTDRVTKQALGVDEAKPLLVMP